MAASIVVTATSPSRRPSPSLWGRGPVVRARAPAAYVVSFSAEALH